MHVYMCAVHKFAHEPRYKYVFVITYCESYMLSVFIHPSPLQCRQLEVLLAGFSNRNELVGIMSNQEMMFRRKDRKSWTTDTPHLQRLYKLIYRMTVYLEHATVSA